MTGGTPIFLRNLYNIGNSSKVFVGKSNPLWIIWIWIMEILRWWFWLGNWFIQGERIVHHGYAREKSSWPFPGWGRSGPYCRDLAFLPTKWIWDHFSSLQNGMATNLGPTKWCSLSTILDAFYPQRFWFFRPKMVKHVRSSSKGKNIQKKQEPFCRASTLSGTENQVPFSHSHFVDFFFMIFYHVNGTFFANKYTYRMVNVLERWVLYKMAIWLFLVDG